jgi:aspartyl/asparaginyl beta-hydroxylase (cupin superfamily)
MVTNPPNTAILIEEAVLALQRGDGRTAYERLKWLATILPSQTMPWLDLAQACAMIADDQGQDNALQQLLAIEPRNLPALLMMGELKARAGDDRAATAFYRLAMGVANAANTVPTILHPMLQRAQEFLGQANYRFENHLLDRLHKASRGNTGRIRESLDLLLGKTELYQQQPSMFYFPGLPQRQFYERTEFDWLKDMESFIPQMQKELHQVLARRQQFNPYVELQPGRPQPNNPLLNDPSWGAFYFWKGGEVIAENAAHCPATMAALSLAPMPEISLRSPMALYSLLKPGTHIAPHHGMLNTRLVCHIPLIIPEDCALRVGNETRAWKEGQALIFDDSFEHEAWNRSDKTRIVLLFEIWRPEITLDERAALTTLFEAINDYSGAPSAD